jgi:hypothetical protein
LFRRIPNDSDEESPRVRRGALLVAVLVSGILSLVSSGTAWATANWTVHVATVNSGEAQAQALPTATAATSACTSPVSAKTVKVSWTAITHVTAYAVYQSNTSATGTYTLQTSGVATTSWTTAALATGDYWYEVVADIGTNWASAKSAASAERIISSLACS